MAEERGHDLIALIWAVEVSRCLDDIKAGL